MSSAWSITRSVNPPRATFLDYPLGHTAGKPGDPDNQLSILRDVLRAFQDIDSPGEIRTLDYQWTAEDSWKDSVMRPKSASGEHEDDRIVRHDSPQYQSKNDEELVEAECTSCVFLQA